MTSVFSINFLEPDSDVQTPIYNCLTSGRFESNSCEKSVFFFYQKGHFGTKKLGFAERFHFLAAPVPVVTVLNGIGLYLGMS